MLTVSLAGTKIRPGEILPRENFRHAAFNA